MESNAKLVAVKTLEAGENWRRTTVGLPLAQRPRIDGIGVGVHGLVPREVYRLPHQWCLHLYRYHAQLWIDGRDYPIHPGYASLVAPNQRLEYKFSGRSQHLYVHFQFDIAASDVASSIQAPIMQDAGDEFAQIYEGLAEMIGSPVEQTSRLDARLWETLWRLAERPGITQLAHNDVSETYPAAVRCAIQSIEASIDRPLSVRSLADSVGVSYGYLSQLFQRAMGMTVVEYIRVRRMQRAQNLLANSDLPIKTIAAMLGYIDLQQFNKAVRQTLGSSPRKVRLGEPRRAQDQA